MAKTCVSCGKELSKKATICPACKPLTWKWYDAAVVFGAILVIILVLTQITVPYVREVTYTVQERYQEEEDYFEKEQYIEKVPYTITQFAMIEVPYSPEKTVTKEFCYYRDIAYKVNYMPGLHAPYNAATENGYRFGKGDAGGSYVQVTQVCHPPTRELNKDSRFNAVFAICNYIGEEKVDCPDRLYTKGGYATGRNKPGSLEDPNYQGVRSSLEDLICFNTKLIWETPYDERKSIRLEPISLPQIRVCEKNEVSEKINLYTEHNVVRKQPTKKVEKEIQTTKYRDEIRFREMPQKRLIEKIQDVSKRKYEIKYRPLWEELWVEYLA